MQKYSSQYLINNEKNMGTWTLLLMANRGGQRWLNKLNYKPSNFIFFLDLPIKYWELNWEGSISETDWCSSSFEWICKTDLKDFQVSRDFEIQDSNISIITIWDKVRMQRMTQLSTLWRQPIRSSYSKKWEWCEILPIIDKSNHLDEQAQDDPIACRYQDQPKQSHGSS